MKKYPYVQASLQVGYKFKVNNIASSTETLTFYYNGNTAFNYNLNCASLNIAGYDSKYYWLNNSGYGHITTSDFNVIGEYGFRYIFSPASNSPDASFDGWYSWYLGLGSEYNNNFGAQLAFPRNSQGPRFYIRYKEGAGFGSWYNMSTTYSDVAGALSSGNKTISGNLQLNGELTANFTSVSSTNTDYCGIQIDTVLVSTYNYALKVLRGTFNGFHRCFIDNEELFDNENIQKFKDDYVGRIVISSGKVATDTSDKEGNWQIKYDNDGITIKDAVPMIQLSRTKKDERVLGVLGDPKWSNTREERTIVNSVGEGGIMAINSNGNI